MTEQEFTKLYKMLSQVMEDVVQRHMVDVKEQAKAEARYRVDQEFESTIRQRIREIVRESITVTAKVEVFNG